MPSSSPAAGWCSAYHRSSASQARCWARRRARRAMKASAASAIIPAQTMLPLAHDASRGVYQWKAAHARAAASSGVSPVISRNA